MGVDQTDTERRGWGQGLKAVKDESGVLTRNIQIRRIDILSWRHPLNLAQSLLTLCWYDLSWNRLAILSVCLHSHGLVRIRASMVHLARPGAVSPGEEDQSELVDDVGVGDVEVVFESGEAGDEDAELQGVRVSVSVLTI
jgi:hypothetical protein